MICVHGGFPLICRFLLLVRLQIHVFAPSLTLQLFFITDSPRDEKLIYIIISQCEIHAYENYMCIYRFVYTNIKH